MLPSGNLIAMGNFALFKFTTGAPSIRKCAVAPESEIACSTLCTNYVVLHVDVVLFALYLLLLFRCLLLFSFRFHLEAHLFILPLT